MYYQMTQYLAGRDIDINDVIDNDDKMEKLGVEFLNDVYPGMLKAPNELIKLMTAEDADKAVASMALNPSNYPCDESHEMTTEPTNPATTSPTDPNQTGGKKLHLPQATIHCQMTLKPQSL